MQIIKKVVLCFTPTRHASDKKKVGYVLLQILAMRQKQEVKKKEWMSTGLLINCMIEWSKYSWCTPQELSL